MTGSNDAMATNNGPPSPWRNSKSKLQIIDELKNETSDIHLLIGRYTSSDFSNVKFKQILGKYAGNKYKLSNFKDNIKRLLNHYQQQTGPFKAEGVEPWYTSPTNVSRAYALLFTLHMDSTKSQIINNMSAEEIWRSHNQFQLYELNKFKTYIKNMEKLTSKRKTLICEEEECFKRDMSKHTKHSSTSRGYPFWHNHQASKLLKEHISNEMLDKVIKMKPQQLWKLREEYQAFPLHIFRKHIYQERTKQLAAPYWQHKRNKNAQKKYEETEEMLKEWNQAQMNTQIDQLACDWETFNFEDN